MNKNIDIYGKKYSKLTDEEKLEVLNYKIEELFVRNKDNTVIVNKYLHKDKLDKIELEIYQDLLRKKIALEEKIKNNNTETIITEVSTNNKEINSQNEPVTNQDINILSEEYKKLTKKEKLEIVNKRIQELFVPSSKNTMVVIYNYERKNIEKSKKGIFKDLLERKKALEKETTTSGEIVLTIPPYDKEQNKTKKQVVVPVVVKVKKKNLINNSNKEKKQLTKKQIIKRNKLEKTIVKRKEQTIERKAKLEKVINNHSKNEAINLFVPNTNKEIEKNKIITSINSKESKNKKTLPAFLLGVGALSKKAYNGAKEKITSLTTKKENKTTISTTKESKNKKIILPFLLGIGAFFKNTYNSAKERITSLTSKIFTKKEPETSLENERKRKKQRKLALLCAGLILLTLLPFGKTNKKNTSVNNEPQKETTSQTDTKPNNNNNIQEDDNIIEDNEEINKEDEEINKDDEDVRQENSISLDDTVTINDNSYIYRNMYDMTYNTNAYNPYYNGTYERDVQGVVYSLNNKLYIVYETDADAASKIEELEKNNAILTGVLVTRTDKVHTGDYEGYYNIDSVKIKTRKINN